ncbi:MAG: type I-E CRISPR-associated protein Cse1/CasA [Anaerolineaceae bacterium]|nr:type I-E CRISPR-associated protein Cse1/CasA [Anaerolineaceae bacterium]
MSESNVVNYTYNLWEEPWIALEKKDGGITWLGIGDTITQADNLFSIYDPSPLVIVGIYRLLTAILQDSLNPIDQKELWKIWNESPINQTAIETFKNNYIDRFDLFSEKKPFLQSGDIKQKSKEQKLKPIGYIFQDLPTGTNVVHFQHSFEDEQMLCPACCAKGLLTIPSFATTGGAGIKPSINGVPPIYIIPSGNTLRETLTQSLITPEYMPEVRDTNHDLVWWRHPPEVIKSDVVREVGYLHSLTFPARRVRLFAEKIKTKCTRCGRDTALAVRNMIFEMGESRPKDSAFWFDPFAAYKIKDKTNPIRPQKGLAVWREYSGLFLKYPNEQSIESKKVRTQRPRVLNQIDDLASIHENMESNTRQFRAIGIRTDMKAKIFEWLDSGFDIPLKLMHNDEAGVMVDEAMDFAGKCQGSIGQSFRKSFGGGSKDKKRYETLISEMISSYWVQLAEPFRRHVLNLADKNNRIQIKLEWVKDASEISKRVFLNTLRATNDSGSTLHQRVDAENRFIRDLNFLVMKERQRYEP